jgi:hypothetical protein
MSGKRNLLHEREVAAIHKDRLQALGERDEARAIARELAEALSNYQIWAGHEELLQRMHALSWAKDDAA